MRKCARPFVRSCNACAKAKLRCDLRTPQCSRCIKKKSSCVYADTPLSSWPDSPTSSATPPEDSPSPAGHDGGPSSMVVSGLRVPPGYSEGSALELLNPATASFDPFDSYPSTRLPRAHVQRLINHCMPLLPIPVANPSGPVS